MGEPVENANFDASTSLFFAMKKEKLLQLCKYYKGEERCPETYTTDAARKLWRAEYMICNDLSDMVKVTKLRESFIGAVCAYVEKWDMQVFTQKNTPFYCLALRFSLLLPSSNHK